MLNRRSRVLAAAASSVSLLSLSLGSVVGTSAPAQAATVTNPFPTHVTYKVGVMPSASQSVRDAAVETEYNSWKATYLVKGCASNEYYVSTKGDGDAPNNGTVSEAQGYGMNIVPLMAGYDASAQTEFAGLWQLVKDHEDADGLMQWQLDGKTCKYTDTGTPDGATDGDLDIGYGLILADEQWGGYTADAQAWLASFYAHDVAPDGHLKAEDDGPNTDTRPSDSMFDHLRAFVAYDPAHDWTKVLQRQEAVFTEFTNGSSPTAGLLSDFVVASNTTSPKPAPANYQEDQPDNIVGYNSIRVPWHLGTDALENGSSVASVEYGLAKEESACLNTLSGGNPANVQPHIKLTCANDNVSNDTQAEEAGDSVGPSAMASGNQAWTDAIWKQMGTNPFGDTYYGETIKMIVYIVMAGDYWNPASTSTAPSNDFSVSDSPASASVAAGGSATSTVSTAVTSGSAQTVALTTSGAPSGVTVSLSPASVTAGSSSTLTAKTTTATAAGSYPITVTGTAASGTHTVTYTLTVTTSGSGAKAYEAEATTNTFTGTARAVVCSTCSAGSRVGYIGKSGNTLTVNGITESVAGSYSLQIAYVNPASGSESATVTVDGVASNVTAASTGTGAPGTITITVKLNAGSSNTIEFSNPSARAFDVDKITV